MHNDSLSHTAVRRASHTDGIKLLDRVEAQLHVLVLELVNEHRDRVKTLIVALAGTGTSS